MDIVAFIRFTFNSRYIARWIYGGLIMYIPVANFFSLGYLAKTARILLIGSIGLPTWEDKTIIWTNGIKLLFVFILYEAVPFFLFSTGFFLTTLGSIPAFFGNIVIKFSYLALLIFSFFIPFAFSVFSEKMEFRDALEFERIFNGIKEVFVPYLGGYLCALIALYICKVIIKIPYLIGFVLSSLCTYYVFLLATYYFIYLFKKTSLVTVKMIEERTPETAYSAGGGAT
jgi:hypothetical protein